MVTSALLITAPVGSLTVPTTLPVSIVVCASNGQARIESDDTVQNVKEGIRLDFLAAARMIWRDAPTARDGGTCLTEAAPKLCWEAYHRTPGEKGPKTSITSCAGGSCDPGRTGWLIGQSYVLQQGRKSGVSTQALEIRKVLNEGDVSDLFLVRLLEPLKRLLLIADSCVGTRQVQCPIPACSYFSVNSRFFCQ